MPYKDHQKKLDSMYDWRHKRTPEYHKWLYQRRNLRFSKAESFEQTLRLIAAGDLADPVALAKKRLKFFETEETRVGRFFDHTKNEPSNTRTVASKPPGD